MVATWSTMNVTQNSTCVLVFIELVLILNTNEILQLKVDVTTEILLLEVDVTTEILLLKVDVTTEILLLKVDV
jgi:hypothetical protein